MWWETLVYFASGGLDEALYNVIAMAREQEIPFVFALGRKALGRCVNKLVPVSVVGIFNYSGAEVRQCHPRKRSLRAVPHLTFFLIYNHSFSFRVSSTNWCLLLKKPGRPTKTWCQPWSRSRLRKPWKMKRRSHTKWVIIGTILLPLLFLFAPFSQNLSQRSMKKSTVSFRNVSLLPLALFLPLRCCWDEKSESNQPTHSFRDQLEKYGWDVRCLGGLRNWTEPTCTISQPEGRWWFGSQLWQRSVWLHCCPAQDSTSHAGHRGEGRGPGGRSAGAGLAAEHRDGLFGRELQGPPELLHHFHHFHLGAWHVRGGRGGGRRGGGLHS